MMPLERSPAASPKKTSDSLFEESQLTNVRRAIHFTDEDAQGQSSEINSNEFRLVKLPTFWRKQPKLWFAQLESEFLVSYSL